MSNARKQNEIAFHDRLFGAKDDPRNAIAKYYRVSDVTHSLYRELVADHCPGRRLLEYGCGTGDDSLFWAQSGARVTGIDLSSEAIKKARENARREERITRTTTWTGRIFRSGTARSTASFATGFSIT